MDKKLERNMIWTLAIILIVLGLTSCVKPMKIISKPVEDKILLTDTISNMGSIAEALGCMFAPATCQKEEAPSSALVDDKLNP